MTSIPEYHVLPNTQRDSDAMSLNAFARSVQAEMARFRVREQQGVSGIPRTSVDMYLY